MIKIIFKIFLLLLIIAIVAAGIFLYKKHRQAEEKIMGMTPANVSEKIIYFLPQQGNPKRKLRLEIPKIVGAPTNGEGNSYLSIREFSFVILEAILRGDWENAIKIKQDKFNIRRGDLNFSARDEVNMDISFISPENMDRIKKNINFEKKITDKKTFISYQKSLSIDFYFPQGVLIEVFKKDLDTTEKNIMIEEFYYSLNPMIVEDK